MSAKNYLVENYDHRTNFCDYFSEPIKVTTMVNGIELQGHFTFISPSDYSVMLDYPYSRIKDGLHTPYFAMYEKNRNIVNGQLTNKCFEYAKGSLISAYKEAHFLFKNKGELYKRILLADKKIEKIALKLDLVKTKFSKDKKEKKLC